MVTVDIETEIDRKSARLAVGPVEIGEQIFDAVFGEGLVILLFE